MGRAKHAGITGCNEDTRTTRISNEVHDMLTQFCEAYGQVKWVVVTQAVREYVIRETLKNRKREKDLQDKEKVVLEDLGA